MAMIVALAIGIPAGIISAVKKGTTVDYAANVVALSGLSIPNFWLGIMLIMLVSVQLGTGCRPPAIVPPAEDLWLNIKTMLMPAFVLGNGLAASLMRHTRSAMLGVLRSDYIRTARAKGLLERGVVLKHALRNALIPIVTLSTLLFGELLAGAVLTEQIFTIPGFGKLIVDAVFNRDYAVVQGVVLCTAVGFIVHEPAGRRPLRPASIPRLRQLPHDRTSVDRRRSRRCRQAAQPRPRASSCATGRRSSAAPSSSFFVLARSSRPCSRLTIRSKPSFAQHPQGALGRLLVRHRRTRPRHALAHASGARGPRCMAGVVSVTIARR